AGGAGQDDVEQRLAFGHAEGAGCFDFAWWHGLDGAAQDFGDVGRGVQRHDQGGAEERLAQVRPQRALGDDVELRQAVID
nr:hypothetical protein [Tanacetum cinerariifolium]